jgi:hypothetical protein
MADIQPIGIIHQIMIGDVKNGFSIRVGQDFHIGRRKIIVSQIIKDENHYYERGILRYLVWAQEETVDGLGPEFVWQELINHSYKVTCKIP